MKTFSKIHYSWMIMVAGILVFFCSCGLTINFLSVYQPLIGETYGYTQTQINFFATMKAIGQVSVMPFIIRFYKRVQIRTGIAVGLLLGIIPYFLFALIPAYPTFFIGSFLMGASNTLAGMIVLSMLMERWFTDDCTFAISTSCMGSSLATIGLPSLVVSLIEKTGLKGTFLIHGSFMILVAVICILIIRNYPKEKGLEPYRNLKPKKETKKAAPIIKYTSITRKGIIIASLFMAILTGVIGGPGWSCVSLLVTREGYSADIMAIAFSIMSISMLFGKFMFGWCSEKITMRITTIIYAVLNAVGLFMLCFISLSPLILFAGAALYGGSVGFISIGVVAWVRDWFDEKTRDKYKQRYNIMYFVGSISFSLIPGIIADATERGYVITYGILTGAAILILIILILIYNEAGKNKNEQTGQCI